MHYPVEIVALPAEQAVERLSGERLEPRVVRHLGIGVVRPDLVQAEEEKDHGVRDARQGEPLVAERYEEHEGDYQDILEGPAVAMPGVDGERCPNDAEYHAEHQQVFPVRGSGMGGSGSSRHRRKYSRDSGET
jgi:hypothetical protein